MKDSIFRNEEINTILSATPSDSFPKSLLISSYNASQINVQKQTVKKLKPKPKKKHKDAQDQPNPICSIPSIPNNRRKFGYYETNNGLLCPLEDAMRFLRESSVFLYEIYY